MDFRRIPFQFSTTDASKRQEELQRRFGLPANKSNMYVDFANSGAMGTRPDNSSASNSPRLQHRVPIFVEGLSEPTKPSVDAQNVDSGRKPHVRVIPIEIEGEDSASKRHRWLSGSSDPIKEKVNGTSIPVETIKYPAKAPSTQSPKTPRVCNIPIKIEGSADVTQPKLPVKTPVSPKNTGVKVNVLNSNVPKVGEKRESPATKEKKSSGREQITLKKIEDTLEKLKGYHSEVEKFSGTSKEKSYRYLDEMLTRCMLELDEIDTLGLDTIRLARKAAVKKVQASIDLLESRVIKEEKVQKQVSKEPMEIESAANQTLEDIGAQVEGVINETSKVIETREAETAQVEMSAVFPEQISEKVENITIMEAEESVLKPDDDSSKLDFDHSANESSEKMNVEVTEPVRITEVEMEANVITSEIEPIVEEPLSDSKDENVDMDLSICNCDSNLNLDKPSVEICEVVNNVSLDTNKSEELTNNLVDVNLEMEIAQTAGIPIVSEQTVMSNIPVMVDTAEQTVICNDSNKCVDVSDSNIPTNS